MKVGGEIEDHVRVIIRMIGLLAPLALALYGYMVSLGYAPNDHFLNTGFYVAFSSLWAAYGIWQYFWPSSWKYQTLFTLTLYHIFGMIFIVFISGFSTFVLAAWSILALASYLYYGANAYALSIVALIFTAGIDLSVHQTAPFDSSMMLLNIIGVVFVSGCSAAIAYGYRAEIASPKFIKKAPSNNDHERLVTIINNLTDAVFVTNAKGKIEIFNAASLNLLDTNADIKGKSVDEMLPIRDIDDKPARLTDELVKAKHVVIDDSYRMGSAEDPMRVELTYAPIRGSYRNGIAAHGSEGYIIIARDVTKEKSLEEERDEFISVVSHELRTPVTVAEGSISNAQLFIERGKDTKEKLAEALDEAHEQVVFLAGMINDLSTLSRAERGVAAENEAIDVTSFVHDIYNEYSPQAQKQKLTFNLEAGPQLGQVMTSRLYLHELMQNFITNAIKYTKKGTVTFHISNQNGMILFKVTDTGIGISKSDQVKIFNKFYRSEDYRTRETSGTGLGLYVASKLAKKLKTTIEVKSRLNHGSTFSISLPEYKDSTNITH